MSLFIYGTATNTGKGFFTHQDRLDFHLSGYPANVWVVGNNEKGAVWLASKNGITKTKAEAQAIVDAEITAAQTEWDALTDEQKTMSPGRPGNITLPQEFIMSDYNVIRGLKIKYLSADPSNPENGQVWYNSSNLRVEGVLGTGTWSAGGAANTAAYQLAGAGTQTAALKMGGSPNGSSSTNAVEEYNGSSWTSVTGMPGALSYTEGCGTQTAGLIAGGAAIPSYASTTTFEYDGTNWANGGALNTPTGSCGQLAGIQTASLIAGGDQVPGPRQISTVAEYNGSAWTNVTSLPAARRSQGVAGTQTASIFIGGQPNTNTTVEYDGTNWTSGGDLPANRRGMGGAGTSTLAIGFGGNPGSTPGQLDITLDYNGTSWSEGATMGTAIQLMGYSSSAPSTSTVKFGGASPITAATEEYTVPSGTANITSS